MPLEAARAVLDRRLDGPADWPIAVAVSGGSDSLALLNLAAAWASARGRSLLVLHVDHGLNPASGDWAARVEAAAVRQDAAFRRLAWTGDKPKTGLPAAARSARHALLADAARGAGARVILLGHTTDDLAEAVWMRREGSSVGAPREWSPSPAWPQGRGIFLLRPLLGLRRQALRDYLLKPGDGMGELGEGWIEDPANADPRFARARARRDLAGAEAPPPPPDTLPVPDIDWRSQAGGLIAPRAALANSGERALAGACLCAAGSSLPPRGRRLTALSTRLKGPGRFTATLAGARIEADDETVLIAFEPGEAKRHGLAPLSLAAGEVGVWDGRWLVSARAPVELRALTGLAARLSKPQKTRLKALPPALRGGLPAAVDAAGGVFCPALARDGPVLARPLAWERLAGFLGLIGTENAVGELNGLTPHGKSHTG